MRYTAKYKLAFTTDFLSLFDTYVKGGVGVVAKYFDFNPQFILKIISAFYLSSYSLLHCNTIRMFYSHVIKTYFYDHFYTDSLYGSLFQPQD